MQTIHILLDRINILGDPFISKNPNHYRELARDLHLDGGMTGSYFNTAFRSISRFVRIHLRDK